MAESLTPLQRWLHFVDEQLSAEAVEYLKLGLHSEFLRYYSEVEELDKPSLLYHFLLDRCKRQSESQALKIFLHVVRGLGGALRGNLVISKGFGRASLYNVKDPGLFDIEKASVNFKFFQCLLKISTKARHMALGDQLKKKFAKDRFLNTNYRHIKSLPELFIRLYQKGFIAGNNTHHLTEAFSKYKAWVCLQILNSYHKSVGLQPIPLAQKMEKKFGPISYSSSDPSSYEDSTSDTTASDMLFRRSFYEGTELDAIDENDPVRFSYVPTVHSTANPDEDSDPDTCIIDSGETEKMIKRHKDAATGQLGENIVVVMSRPSKNSKLGCKLLISTATILLLFMVIAMVTLLVKVWLPLQPLPASRLQILKGSTVIVDEIDSMFHATVDINANVISTNTTTNMEFYIDFYGIPEPCENIYGMNFPPKTINICFTEKNISSSIPNYALRGSTYHYDIYGSNTSEVEYVNVCAYRGSDYNHGSREKCRKLFLREDCGTYEAPEPGYYFFKVVNESLDEIIDYKLCIEEKLHILHPNTDESLPCSINATNGHCQFPLPLKSKYCLMAESFPNGFVPSVTLDVQVKDSRVFLLVITPLLSLSFLVILASLLVCFPFCCCRFCKTRHSMVTIV